MILFDKTLVQKECVFTLTELAINKNNVNRPLYYFEFKHLQTNSIVGCLATDISNYIDRYNMFTIADSANPTFNDGECNFKIGEYYYTVYECINILEASKINYSNYEVFKAANITLNKVEEGIFKVFDKTDNLNTIYSKDVAKKTDLVYKK
jgi:hypothetical protein